MEVDNMVLSFSIGRMEKIAPFDFKTHFTDGWGHCLVMSKRPRPSGLPEDVVPEPLRKTDNHACNSGLRVRK